MNIDVWLAPVSESNPCGPNLEYDAEFQQLEDAARAQPDQEFGAGDGGSIQKIEGSGPAWSDVRRLAESLLTRSKDLRVAVLLTRALLHTEGFAGLYQGTLLIKGLVDRYWDHLHPELDADDNNDPTMRVNALAPMAASDAVLADLRAAWIIRSRQHGTLTVRDIDVAQGRIAARAGSAGITEPQLAAIIASAVAENPTLASQARETFEAVKAINAQLSELVGAAASIDFKPLVSALFPLLQLLESAAPAAPSGSDTGMAEPPDTSAPAGATAVAGRPGEIRSRDDVVTSLNKICDYLSRTEPNSPVPIVLRRAQRMMTMNFLELINDMAPDGLPQAEKVVGEKLEG